MNGAPDYSHWNSISLIIMLLYCPVILVDTLFCVSICVNATVKSTAVNVSHYTYS